MITGVLLILGGLIGVNRARDPVVLNLSVFAIIGGALFALGKMLP